MRLRQQKPAKRRIFLGGGMTSILTPTLVAALSPIPVYIFPPRNPNQRKQTIRIALDTPVGALKEGGVSRFAAPAGMAFVMADGGEGNTAGDPTFAGYLTRDNGTLRALAITCPHLGCSYAYDDGKRHFVCPCHGSEFALDGALLHGPATSPLSHLTWSTGPGANEIDVEGLNIGS